MHSNVDLQKAKNYAFLLFKFRPRSEREIIFRLKEKEFPADVIKKTISFLKKEKLLQEEEGSCEGDIARKIVQEKLKELTDLPLPKAQKKIFEYLLTRGFSEDVASEVILKSRSGLESD